MHIVPKSRPRPIDYFRSLQGITLLLGLYIGLKGPQISVNVICVLTLLYVASFYTTFKAYAPMACYSPTRVADIIVLGMISSAAITATNTLNFTFAVILVPSMLLITNTLLNAALAAYRLNRLRQQQLQQSKN